MKLHGMVLLCIMYCVIAMFFLEIPGNPKKYSRLTKHQTIAFCSINYIFLDYESLLNLNFDTSVTQI